MAGGLGSRFATGQRQRKRVQRIAAVTVWIPSSCKKPQHVAFDASSAVAESKIGTGWDRRRKTTHSFEVAGGAVPPQVKPYVSLRAAIYGISLHSLITKYFYTRYRLTVRALSARVRVSLCC